jgi:penicillin-binding protein 1C
MKKLTRIFLFFGSLLLLMGIFFVIPVQIPVQQRWVFYDRQGSVLFSEKNFSTTSSPDFIALEPWVSSIEDNSFRSHSGVSIVSLFRATKQNFQEKSVVSGGSTLTMQLARQLFLAEESHSFSYKLKQIFWALKLETRLTKDEIFNLYAQRVYLGSGATGFDGAAKRYFSKDVPALTLGERAVLVGTLPRPDTWNPLANAEMAKQRRNLVLSQWAEQGLITPEELIFWKETPLLLHPTESTEIHAPHFVFWVKQQLAPLISSHVPEVHVRTTLDKNSYQSILQLVRKVTENSEHKNISNASVVVLNSQGEIEVMLGSVDFFNTGIDGNVNLSTASREMGSTLKPFLFALALESGFSPTDELLDERQSFLSDSGAYSPRNYDPQKEYGSVRFREALAGSYNISAVSLLDKMGVEPFYAFLKKIGFHIEKTPAETGLALVLGSGESRLIDLTAAFQIFPQKGFLLPLKYFSSVTDGNGNILVDPKTFYPEKKRVMSLSTAEWIIHVLSDKIARWSNFPQGNALELEFDTLAKTGTSQDFRDNFVVGASSQYTVGVWAGNADGTPMRASSGLSGAGPIWQGVMQSIHTEPPSPFSFQSQRKEAEICRRPSSNLGSNSNSSCPEKITEFLTEKELADMSQKIVINSQGIRISFPNQGDRFHRDSKISVRTKNSKGAVQIFLDGKKTPAVLENLSLGRHVIRVESDGESDEIEVFVEF